MPKLVVGPHTYAWGNDVLGLPEDPKQYGPRVLNLADVKSLVGAFDIAGWEALREPRVFSVYLLDGLSRRQVLVGDTQFPLTVWQRPVEGDVPSEAVNELEGCLRTIRQQQEEIEKLRAGGDHHPIELELTSPAPADIVAVPIDDPVESPPLEEVKDFIQSVDDYLQAMRPR